MPEREALVLYGKGGCSPCLQAERVLAPLARRLGLELRWVDVDLEDSPAGYRDEVPVVTFGDAVLARGRVVAGTIEAKLEDLRGSSGQPPT